MSILKTNVRLINGRMKFEGTVAENPPVITDYIPPLGDGQGYMPLELFLISLSTCLGGVLMPLLKKGGAIIESFSIDAKGERRETHPTYFEKITLDINLQSQNARREDVENAVNLAETRLCPVIAMLNDKVKLEYNINLSH